MNWQIVYTRQAQKDAIKLAASGLKAKAQVAVAPKVAVSEGNA